MSDRAFCVEICTESTAIKRYLVKNSQRFPADNVTVRNEREKKGKKRPKKYCWTAQRIRECLRYSQWKQQKERKINNLLQTDQPKLLLLLFFKQKANLI